LAVQPYGKFGACAQSPTSAHSQDLVFVAGQAGVLKEPRLRPGKATGGVEKPMIERITGPAAHRRDKIDLFGNRAERGCPGCNDAIIKIIRERDISLKSDKQS